MRLGSLAVAAAMSVFVALSVGPVSATPPASGSPAGTSASVLNEAYAQYRRGGYRGAYRGAYYRGGYRRAYYAPRGVYRRTYRRAYRRAAYYPSSYYGYTYPSSYYRPYAYRGAYYRGGGVLSACLLSTGGPTVRACLLPAPLTRRTRQRAARPRGRVPASTKAAIQHDLTPKAEHDWYHRRKDRCRLGRRGSDLLWRGVRWAARGIGRYPEPGGKRRRS